MLIAANICDARQEMPSGIYFRIQTLPHVKDLFLQRLIECAGRMHIATMFGISHICYNLTGDSFICEKQEIGRVMYGSKRQTLA